MASSSDEHVDYVIAVFSNTLTHNMDQSRAYIIGLGLIVSGFIILLLELFRKDTS